MDIAAILQRLDALEKEVYFLRKENAELRERLSKYENPKNSRNSSIPPSKDENRPKPNQSLRKRSGKKPGGQKGRKGKTLEMTDNPDEIVVLQPDYCSCCGLCLSEREAVKEQSRQIVDIPPIKAIYTEYQSYSKTCSCGFKNKADFPQGVNAPVSYGENIEALVGYLHARQYVPFARMKEIFNHVFGTSISEGGLHYLLERFAKKTSSVYQIIKQRIEQAAVVGTDETGVKINGGKHWFWTWQTPYLTYIAHSGSRGYQTIDKEFPNGFPDATLVHDGWRAQLKTVSENHQSCLAHLQRSTNYLIERYPKKEWPTKFKELLNEALELKRKWNPASKDFIIKRTLIVQKLEELLKKPPDKKQKELHTFYKRILRERQHIFTFLFLRDVPPDNNASERAIRNVKVKQKISGQFKTERTAQNFAKIRSVIDTTLKNQQNVLQALRLIAKFEFKL